MTDIRNEIELVTPGLNLLEDHGEGAKSVIERTKKILHEAAERIEELQKQRVASDKRIEELEEQIFDMEYEMFERGERS